MSFSLYENFLNLFTAQKPKDYHLWQEQRDLRGVTNKAGTLQGAQDEFRTKGTVFSEKDELRRELVPELVEIRKKVDELQVTVLHMIPRWQETPATEVTNAIDLVQDEVRTLRQEADELWNGETDPLRRSKAEMRQLNDLHDDLDGIQTTLDNERKLLGKRKDLAIGTGSDFVNSGLKQGWVPPSKEGEEGTFQYQSKEEWENLQKRGVKQEFTTKDMVPIVPKVHIRDGQDTVLAKQRLEVERGTSVVLRSGMTSTYKKRLEKDGPVKDGVVNNIEFAKKLASMLGDDDIDPNLLTKVGGDGLMNRVMGEIQGQGQFAPNTTPKTISETFGKVSVDDLKDGEANRVQQFISGFVDGLTEVNETNKTAENQFEVLWKKMETTFGLKPEDKTRLMERVDVYKKLAGGLADTSQSGKGSRKHLTRGGKMPLGELNTIEDPEAIIANDISGSMHSQFLAMELAETLSGKAKDELGQPITGFKTAGSSVQVKNKDVLDSRMLDALSLTAGGKFKNGTGDDFVMHTAYEMINGVQAITGVANKITQKTATAVMKSLAEGISFSGAMEAALPDEIFPWQLRERGVVDGRAASALKTAREGSTEEKDLVPAAVQKLVEDVLWLIDADEAATPDFEAIQEALAKSVPFTTAMQTRFPRETFPWVEGEK